jgi:dolichyl-phosphate beta-glucosyltransferase
MLHKEISVVIPCYREAEVIKNTLLSVYTYLKAHFEHFEIIVVTDGSPDDTKKNIEQLGHAYPEIPLVLVSFQKNRGKGAAVREGVLTSQYDPVLFIDADLTIPIEEIEKFMSALETADIAIASRLVSGSGFEETIPLHRVIMARGFHLLQILILGNFEFSDTQCGFKLFRRETALKLFRQATVCRFAFDAEILFLAQKAGKQVAILPVIVKKDPRNTNVNVFRDPINMFFALLKIRLNDFFGKYR